jgi:hypothetical protein
MSEKTTAFYRGNTEISVDFSAEGISSDGAVAGLEKLERNHKVIRRFSRHIPDQRDPSKVEHSVEKLLKQRVFTLMQGYEDCNDVEYLQKDPLFADVLGGDMASQPTLSRFENSVDKHALFGLCHSWVDRYVDSLRGRSEIIIDIDSTDDPTHGRQQLSMFHGFYGQFMYNELFFHDGQTGQIIVPVLRPGNSHSNRWYVAILKRVVQKIRQRYPKMTITIRADSGFSCPAFYQLADRQELYYVVGMAPDAVLKRRVARVADAVERRHVSQAEKYQHFIGFQYQAGSWHRPQQCYSKIESTGKGLNVRHIVSNLPGKTARQIYFDVYVQRGEASENRIKEVKNMCQADRLSCHRYWANFLRLLISCLAYELFLLLKQAIRKTSTKEAHSWQINTIRVRLLKVGATIRKTKRRIYYRLSQAFVYQNLFRQLVAQ